MGDIADQILDDGLSYDDQILDAFWEDGYFDKQYWADSEYKKKQRQKAWAIKHGPKTIEEIIDKFENQRLKP